MQEEEKVGTRVRTVVQPLCWRHDAVKTTTPACAAAKRRLLHHLSEVETAGRKVARTACRRPGRQQAKRCARSAAEPNETGCRSGTLLPGRSKVAMFCNDTKAESATRQKEKPSSVGTRTVPAKTSAAMWRACRDDANNVRNSKDGSSMRLSRKLLTLGQKGSTGRSQHKKKLLNLNAEHMVAIDVNLHRRGRPSDGPK